MIFGRLVLGWMQENLQSDDYDMVIANPTEPSRPVRHTELILESADREDVGDDWPISPFALSKSRATTQSGGLGANWFTKWNAAQELKSTVTLSKGTGIADARVLLFDDIATTCSQFQVLSRMLLTWGASHVDGLVIARTGG